MKCYKVKILLLFLLIAFGSIAQPSMKYGFELKNYLQQAEPSEMIPLLVEGDSVQIKQLIEKYNGKLGLNIHNLFSIDLPARFVQEFSLSSYVKNIEFSTSPGIPLNDTMLIQTNVDSVIQQANLLRHYYTGKGVVLGVIDSGIELDHGDFKDSLGNTRVLYIWDQKQPYNPNQQALNYNYGIEWDSSAINSGICTHDDRATEFGHGTNVTGAAASNGLATGQYRGVAPEVNIIAVATDFNKPNWLQTVAESVDYIFRKADALGMPCVINASVGTYVGSHDGKDIAARIIDALILQKSGRTMVCAAGNAGNIPFHVRHDISNDTAFTWLEDNPNQFGGLGGVYFEVWGDTANFSTLQFAIGADEETANGFKYRGKTSFDNILNRLNVIYDDSIVGVSGNILARIQTYAESSQGRIKLEVEISNPDTNNLLYRFETKGNGMIDIYSSFALFRHSDLRKNNLPTPQQFPIISKYVKPDSLQTMVSSFTCLPSVITVGNYVNRATYIDVSQTFRSFNVTPGRISINSSLGPNRNNILKPDVSSAGDYMFSAGRLATIVSAISNNPSKVSQDSLHWRNGGTSMASPTVAGMIALYLQMCPKANYNQIKMDLLSSAKRDQFTSSSPNYSYGYGKADAYQFLKSKVFHPSISHILPNLCVGDSLNLAIAPNYHSYLWNTMDTTSSITVKNSGFFYATVENLNSCKAQTDTIYINFDTIPNAPKIQKNGSTLSISHPGFYQWYLNQSPIMGANNSSHIALTSGNYFCKYTNHRGCSNFSDTTQVIVTNLDEHLFRQFVIAPNPSKGVIAISFPPIFSNLLLHITDIQGKHVRTEKIPAHTQQFKLNLGLIPKGIYFLSISSENTIIYKKLVIE